MDPTEKGFTLPTSAQASHAGDGPGKGPLENEPAWIRDSQIAGVAFAPELDARVPANSWIAEICEGETSYCEHCGAGFPMWPTKAWADHLVTAHGDALTIQARTGSSLLCADELNECQTQFFAMMFASRVSLRRRAWQLGYASVKQDERRIHIPN